MKCLMLFGSVSDEWLYSELKSKMETEYEVEMQVISAHRNLPQLQERLANEDYDFIVAGAGLAAHLPGVCAAISKKPVIGIPVSACFDGMDSYFSIVQMPYGIPVATSFPDRKDDIVSFANSFKNTKFNNVNIVIKNNYRNYEYVEKELGRLIELIQAKNVDYSINEEMISKIPNIVFCLNADEAITTENEFVINVPVFDKPVMSQAKTGSQYYFDYRSSGGIFVGVNNSRNAFLFINKFQG